MNERTYERTNGRTGEKNLRVAASELNGSLCTKLSSALVRCHCWQAHTPTGRRTDKHISELAQARITELAQVEVVAVVAAACSAQLQARLPRQHNLFAHKHRLLRAVFLYEHERVRFCSRPLPIRKERCLERRTVPSHPPSLSLPSPPFISRCLRSTLARQSRF